MFLIAVMSWVDPGSGGKNKRSGLSGLLKLAGYALLCGVSRCTKFLAFFHHQHGTSVSSNTYSRWGIRSLGLVAGAVTLCQGY